MPSSSPYLDAAKAEDLSDLLNHLAWTDVLRPELMKERDNLTKLLVAATLGTPVKVQTSTGPEELTKEQLAGKIYGIDSILDKIEKILARGERGKRELRAIGVNL